MVGPKCHVLVRTVVIFRFLIFNSSYTTRFPFILVPTWLLISVPVYNTFDFLPCRARQFTNISAAPVSATVSIDACQTFALGLMNVGLMQICTPLSPSFKIFCPVIIKIKYMYITTRACTLIVNVSVIIEPFHQYSRAH